ncbi:MAG: hypothetical protein AAFW46_18200, partial [Pseudomonadota bacterium]
MSQFERVILHIGAEKTGTTAAQTLLYLNRKKLLRQGVALTDAFGVGNNRALATYAIDPERQDDELYRWAGVRTLEERLAYKAKLRDDFLAEIAALPKKVHTLVLTNEHCHSRIRTAEEAEAIFDLLAPLSPRIEVLVYLRRQIDMAVSAYSTTLKGGRAGVDFEGGGGRDPSYYDHLGLLERWSDAFGRSAMAVRIYDREEPVPFLTDFQAALGLSEMQLQAPERSEQNRELSRSAMAMIRKMPEDMRGLGRTVAGRAVIARYVNAVAEASTSIGDPAGFRPSREEAAAFQAQFEEDNERIRAEWFPDRPRLFPDNLDRYPPAAEATPLDHLSAEDAGAYANAIWWREARSAMRHEAYAKALEARLRALDGDAVGAETLRRQALEIDEDCAAALTDLFVALLESGRVEQAREMAPRLDRLARRVEKSG